MLFLVSFSQAGSYHKIHISFAVDVSGSVSTLEYNEIKNAFIDINDYVKNLKLKNREKRISIYEWSTDVSSYYISDDFSAIEKYIKSERSSYGSTAVGRALMFFMNILFDKSYRENILIIITDGINNEGPSIKDTNFVSWSIVNKVKIFIILIENEDILYPNYKENFDRSDNVIFIVKNFEDLKDRMRTIMKFIE
ncbi:MAG: VWA domain-containing protein [Candidatus Dojkabacteria bacterium]|nr:VWA domain-containing protein [Candidatus Dojkabacteria bacterium]